LKRKVTYWVAFRYERRSKEGIAILN
jgi:hypothetical protein